MTVPDTERRIIAIEGLPGSGYGEFAAWAGNQEDWFAEREDPLGQLPAIERSALPHVLQRLVARYERQQSLAGMDLFRHRVVVDFTFPTHALWAQSLLSDNEWGIYQKVAAALPPVPVKPDVVVYLEARDEQVVQALRSRHKGVDVERWRMLCQAYQRYFFGYEETPLLVVRTDSNQWFEGIGSQEALWDKILSYRGGKTYFLGESGLWSGGTPARD